MSNMMICGTLVLILGFLLTYTRRSNGFGLVCFMKTE